MKNRARIAGATVNQTPLDWENNIANILAAIKAAKEHNVELLLFPELSVTGYGCEDLFFSHEFLDEALGRFHDEILPATDGITIAVGLPLPFAGRVYNAMALVQNRQILGLVCKQQLCGDGVHYEPRWFAPWPAGVVDEVEIFGRIFPVGELIFSFDGFRVTMEICEDAWIGGRPLERLFACDIDLVLCPSASHFAFGKTLAREQMAVESSRRYFCNFIYTNLLGNEAGRIIFDGEILVAGEGQLLSRNERFSMRPWNLLIQDIDLEPGRFARKRLVSLKPQLPERKVISSNRIAHARPKPGLLERDSLRLPPARAEESLRTEFRNTKEEETLYAITLGLFDYMRKSRSNGFVLSLSGGADSSLCGMLASLALERAINELGIEFVDHAHMQGSSLGDTLKKLLKAGKLAEATAELRKKWLSYAYQATANSSQATLQSAQELAGQAGATFFHWTIDDDVASATAKIETAIGRKLDWSSDDIALQNIQARSRAPIIWMLANVRGALLIATGNRSETAAGYATMDGDTAGGLAPIAGLDKAYIRTWLQWAQQALGWSSLEHVNNLQPSAELRPGGDQTDEEDLMPYDLLRDIEALVVGQGRMPRSVAQLLYPRWVENGPLTKKEFGGYVHRFFRLLSISQWKRERYAPSFHLDDYNLDPRSWYRFPILSGGFRGELGELDRFLESL